MTRIPKPPTPESARQALPNFSGNPEWSETLGKEMIDRHTGAHDPPPHPTWTETPKCCRGGGGGNHHFHCNSIGVIWVSTAYWSWDSTSHRWDEARN